MGENPWRSMSINNATPKMENQLEKNMEHEMENVGIYGFYRAPCL